MGIPAEILLPLIFGNSGGGGSGKKAAYKQLSLPSSAWIGSTSPYTQLVTITDYTVSEKTKVDLTADETAVAVMVAAGTDRIYISNNNGQLTAFAIGGKPASDMTVNAIIQEVV